MYIHCAELFILPFLGTTWLTHGFRTRPPPSPLPAHHPFLVVLLAVVQLVLDGPVDLFCLERFVLYSIAEEVVIQAL